MNWTGDWSSNPKTAKSLSFECAFYACPTIPWNDASLPMILTPILRLSGPLIVLPNLGPLALLQVETCFGLCLFSELLSAATSCEKWRMHVRNHLSEQNLKILCSKILNSRSGDELRQRSSWGKWRKYSDWKAWPWRRSSRERWRSRNQTCDPPSVWDQVVPPVGGAVAWSDRGDCPKTGSLSQKSPLCIQIQAYWAFCHRASATLQSTKTTALAGSCIFELECPHVGEATTFVFCRRYSEQKVGHFQTSSVPLKEKLEGLFPPFLVARGCTTDSCTNIQYDLFMYECNAQ